MIRPETKNRLRPMVYSAVCLALALVLPFVTGSIPQVGKMLLPMHLPILLCGFVVGPWWALAVGFIAPILRHLLFAMPPFPSYVAMAAELAVYGLVSGLAYRKLPQKAVSIYVSLLLAMISGRIASGITMASVLGLTGKSYSFAAFLAANVTGAVPGIILQIILVPILVLTLQKAKVVRP